MTAVLIGLSWCVTAQSIRGYVKDRKTNTVLEGATIRLVPSDKLTVTGEQGFFQFDNLTENNYTLEVRFVGYKTFTKEVSATQKEWLTIALEEDAQLTEEVIVSATRVDDNSPTTFTTIGKSSLQKQNFGQDLPITLNWTPSLVTTSDAGAGVGYTGLRIRGSDATRINVTINGIPVNDSESQGVFWVNTSDLSSSTQSVQIQRGVGTSTNGAGAFGASVNLQTNTRQDNAYADVINAVGSFNTHRHTVAFGTGLINNRFTIDGRLSQIKSDGYIDRASSDLKSYYVAGGYYGDKTIVKAIVFGGKEVTYQAWYGVPESRLKNDTEAMEETALVEGWSQADLDRLLASGRTFNLYTYENQVDNYAQDHYQLHVSHRFTNALTANAALHYTYGRGYYEEFRADNDFEDYGLGDVVIGGDVISSTDLIRRRWLKNDFYGVTYSLNYETEKINSVLGGAFNRYDGDHFGEIIWAQVSAVPKDYQYYLNNGKKTDFTIYWKNTIQFGEKLSAFVDLQYRHVGYRASGKENKQFDFSIDETFNFFNPKAGVTYSVNNAQSIFASYSVGNREPVRNDFIDALTGATPSHENLQNIEAGWRYRKNNVAFTANYYWMNYKNQLVPTGEVNDVGANIRTNVDKSYRTGIELDGTLRISNKIFWNANLTLSRNKIDQFTEVMYDYGTDFDEYNEVINTYDNTDIAFSPNVIVGSGFFYTPIQSIEIGLLSKYVGDQYLDNTSNKNRTVDAYFINDVRLTYTLKPSFMREASLSLLVNNIFDVKYESNGFTYGYFAGAAEYRQNFYFPQAGTNFMLMLALRF